MPRDQFQLRDARYRHPEPRVETLQLSGKSSGESTRCHSARKRAVTVPVRYPCGATLSWKPAAKRLNSAQLAVDQAFSLKTTLEIAG